MLILRSAGWTKLTCQRSMCWGQPGVGWTGTEGAKRTQGFLFEESILFGDLVSVLVKCPVDFDGTQDASSRGYL